MTDQLQRARLIPFDAAGNRVEERRAIELDFNPETLTLVVQSGQARDRGRRGHQEVQHVGNSHATLSFDAIFDTTRPKERDGTQQNGEREPERLDVRHKTSAIANLLQGPGRGDSSPRRVRFHWGTVIFDGILKSFSETLDYFSADGVPLRSKVSVSIDQQDFRYQVNADQLTAQRSMPGVNQANDVARLNDLDSLFDTTVGSGFDIDASLDLNFAAEITPAASMLGGLTADLGLGLDLGVSTGAGISLSAEEAVDLFGAAALTSAFQASVDVSLAARGQATVSGGREAATGPNTSWSADGPRPGTRAVELATAVVAARAAANTASPPTARAGAFSATAPAGRSTAAGRPAAATAPVTPLPIRGSPPLVAVRFGPAEAAGVFSRTERAAPLSVPSGVRSPRWERLDDGMDKVRVSAAGAQACCSPCAGRKRPW